MSFLHEVTLESIHWGKLQHVRLIGKPDKNTRHSVMKKLPYGFYLNADGTWFLAVLSEDTRFEDVFYCFGANIVSMWCYASSITLMDVHKFPLTIQI